MGLFEGGLNAKVFQVWHSEGGSYSKVVVYSRIYVNYKAGLRDHFLSASQLIFAMIVGTKEVNWADICA